MSRHPNDVIRVDVNREYSYTDDDHLSFLTQGYLQSNAYSPKIYTLKGSFHVSPEALTHYTRSCS